MPTPPRSLLVVVGLLVLAVVVAGRRGSTSERPPFHVNPNMDVQPRGEPQSASRFFADGRTMRPPVPGTVARGELRDGSGFWTGTDASGFVAVNPVAADEAFLVRGRRRYEIYCAPCHDRNGDGKGILAERAGVRTPTFHDGRLRNAPDGYFFLVMTNGFGLMPSYAYPLPPRDRWAIVAHLRALQAAHVAREAGTP